MKNSLYREFLNVLLIEDDSDYADMVTNILNSSLQEPCTVHVSQRLSDGLKQLRQRHVDVILLDMDLPDSSGMNTLRQTMAEAPHLPIVILTGHADEKIAVDALHQGAQDYLIKGQNETSFLARAIRYAIERKLVLRALQESDSRFKQMIEKNADPILIIDKQLVIRFSNPAVGQLFGRQKEELVGSVFGFPLPRQGEASEIEIVDSRGRMIIAEMRVVPIQWEGERAFLASLRDITDHKRMLVELEQTRRQELQMKDVFLSKVSHELRSPLSVIHQFTTIMLDGISGEINPDQKEHMEIILRNVDELRKMIDDLLQVTRSEIDAVVTVPPAGPQEIHVVSECIQVPGLIKETLSMLRTIADKNRIHLSTQVAAGIPPVHADPHRIGQVLNNLITNALKFTPPEGAVVITADLYDQNSEMVCVTVADTGPGIPADEREKVFEYLYQLDGSIDDRRKGLGIGLYICREIVERHGGRIWVEDSTAKGCRFQFTLPVFSLANLLKPVLTPETLAAGHLGILTVEVAPRPPRNITAEDQKALAEVWKMLNLSIYPDLDMVLPRIGQLEQGEVFFVVACSTPVGIEALIRRIRSHLRQQTALVDLGLSSSITSGAIVLEVHLNSLPYEEQFVTVVKKIDQLIQTNLIQRRDTHGQEKDINC